MRIIALGHQVVGKYHLRNRAAHWDGKNEFGEVVSSGVYFYTLTAGDFSATRKMLIREVVLPESMEGWNDGRQYTSNLPSQNRNMYRNPKAIDRS